MLGVLGGMGPLATVDFMGKIIRNTRAACDQDHLELLVHSATKIPDRTDFILSRGPDPFPAMCTALQQLERAGATVIAIPCNTAHRWHAALQARTSATVLYIVDAVAESLTRQERTDGSVGLFVTNATLQAGVYQDRLARLGFACVVPGEREQAQIMQAISLVKAGDITGGGVILHRQAEALGRAGCRQVVMACTEIPVALAGHHGQATAVLLDATDALASACVAACGSGAAAAGNRTLRPAPRIDDLARSS